MKMFLQALIFRLKSVFRLLDIDRAIFYSILTRAWSLFAGPLTILLIIRYFSSELQGYYYTFASLLGLSTFFEMGFGILITQFASHEWANLSLDENGRIKGEPDALSRLSSLGRFASVWFSSSAVLYSCCLLITGFILFSKSHDSSINWSIPWIILCFVSGANFSLFPAISFLIGCNQVVQMNFLRMIQAILTSITIWTAIFFGAQLWTMSLSISVGTICCLIFLFMKYRRFFSSLLKSRGGAVILWRKEIWPFQWRLGVSFLSGYFIFQLFVPILFHYQGAVSAGQMGMSWTLISALSEISLTWVTTRIPQFGMLIAKKDFVMLDTLFLRSARFSLLAMISGSVLLWGGVEYLNLIHHPFALRLLPPLPMALFILAMILNVIVGSMAYYLRAHKKEPYMILSLVGAVVTTISNLVLGSAFGQTGIAAGFLACGCLFMVPNVIVFLNCKRNWQKTDEQENIQ